MAYPGKKLGVAVQSLHHWLYQRTLRASTKAPGAQWTMWIEVVAEDLDVDVNVDVDVVSHTHCTLSYDGGLEGGSDSEPVAYSHDLPLA
mmetsp:Transcript_9898/g.22166  ORF Transcript_9898/g.22166 Transcript_9898/m.22166 type:complete len:89 (+) Transcript_9898:296-562(+)